MTFGLSGVRVRIRKSAEYRARELLRYDRPPMRWARTCRRRVAARSDGSATVLVVNWNTVDYLAVCLYAIRRFSPESTRVVVVDNGSGDLSKRFLRRQRDVRRILLPVN